jgi:hypothetical protein
LTAGTVFESPVIADLDGDGHAELIVESDDSGLDHATLDKYCAHWDADSGNQAPWTGTTQGLYIFEDPKKRWSATRSMWTSPTYHITDVNDDLTLPGVETPSWIAHNSYRRNWQPPVRGSKLPDFTARAPANVDNDSPDCAKRWTLRVELCNRGSHAEPRGVAGTFYASDPGGQGALSICTAKTVNRLDPGRCEQVACDWVNPARGRVDLWFRANDDGKTMPVTECRYGNDTAYFPGLECHSVG